MELTTPPSPAELGKEIAGLYHSRDLFATSISVAGLTCAGVLNMFRTVQRKIYHILADPDKAYSLGSRCRALRFEELLRRFPNLEDMRVVDLGGTPDFWRAAPIRPKHVTTVNLDNNYRADESWLDHVVADACELASLEACPGSYDLAISNSLIEHVGGYQRRRNLARVVMAAASSYWVQTPNRYFPIEPHYVAPGFQFLPTGARAAAVQHWPLARDRVLTRADALAHVLSIDLIGPTELQYLFPDSRIWHERIAGLSKSIVAIKKAFPVGEV
jgi:hypothetical protein